MKLKIIAFAHARKCLGFDTIDVECTPCDTPRELLLRWKDGIAKLPPTRIAIDEEFHDWDSPIGEAREMAILPPVSGG
jgi:sulfur-carrier protein